MTGNKKDNPRYDGSVRALLERGPAVMYHCARYWDYGVDYISPNVSDLLGWTDSDFVADPTFRLSLIHPDDLADVLRNTAVLFDVGRQHNEYRLRKADGDYIWVLDDVRALQKEDGSFEGLIGYLSDVTELKTAEQSLRSSEQRHRAIFETVLEGLLTIDSKGIVQDMNKAAQNIFGYSAEMVVGRNVSMLMPEPHASAHDGYLERYLETKDARVIGVGRTVKGRRASGDLFEMHLSVSELNLPEGRYFVGAVRDISKQVNAEKALRESQERLRMSQQFAKLGTWDWHIGEDRLFWSDQVFEIYDIANDGYEERKERYKEWVIEEDVPFLEEAIIKSMKTGEPFRFEYRVRLQNGALRWVREQGSVVRNVHGIAVRMLGVAQDISAEKEYEAALTRSREEAEFANRAKSEFLSRMSHELRTPLNAILGFAQLLGMSGKHPLNERQQKQVQQIATAGDHLMELINEILDLARIEAGRINLNIEALNMASVMDEVMELSENQAIDKEISLSMGTPLPVAVLADRTRLKQILLNLLSNAIKYNKRGGHVRLDVKIADERWVEFAVSDDGYGIAAEQKMQIFKPFNRLGAEKMEIEGTGIGLTLTKQLVEAMDGTITFESVINEGTTFIARLPIAELENDKKTKLFDSNETMN